MKEEQEPIFDFKPLRNYLVQKGYIVEQAQGYREIKPQEITLESVNKGEIEFTDEGIYVVGAYQQKQQVFLYKRDYHLNYSKPRFHICKCEVIEGFISSRQFDQHYVRANTDSVPVYNMDDGYKEVMVDNLQLCGYCRNKLNLLGNNATIKDFVELLRSAKASQQKPQIQEVDIFGYTRDWDSISQAYRAKHNYTCEECGLQVSNPFDWRYMHVHHIDANKLNNDESNLRCLCIRCHADVNEYHRRNFQKGANKILLDDFNATYPANNKQNTPTQDLELPF